MFYVKTRDKYTSYIDPVTRQSIGRGEIAAFKKLSPAMEARIRARGLLKCTEQEYLQYLASKPKAEVVVESVKLSIKKEVSEVSDQRTNQTPAVEDNSTSSPEFDSIEEPTEYTKSYSEVPKTKRGRPAKAAQ